jgi:hypothetical protein
MASCIIVIVQTKYRVLNINNSYKKKNKQRKYHDQICQNKNHVENANIDIFCN